ncbi:BTB/POZ domain-containing protein POB1-like [Impatiens glandulifera]|uniref:BTB/POZ domain-containing protein POB1-like n=1 Tax=Impatiens glandulifera TaxID=253017 RepID=UPI001FB0BDB7|nr:BTB/POZ domain-containing protein POB1-like [Impatiens glandulifera]
MSCRKLRNSLTCVDIDSWVSHKLVHNALFFKAGPPYKQRALSTIANFSVERRYNYHLAKMVEFKSPNPRCIVYLDLKWEECAYLLSKRQSYVKLFPLDVKGFFLFAKFICQVNFSSFGLFLGMQDKGCLYSSVSVEYEQEI